MQKISQAEMTFNKFEPLPALAGFEEDEIPWFGEIARKLKRIMDLQQVPCIKPTYGVVDLFIGLGKDQEPKQVRLDVEFCDGPRDGYISLRLSEQA
jgi:hypothetical protein